MLRGGKIIHSENVTVMLKISENKKSNGKCFHYPFNVEKRMAILQQAGNHM